MVADVEVTRLASDSSGRSFMVSALPEQCTDRDDSGGSRLKPVHRRDIRRPQVLYFYLRDGDLAAAVGKLERLGRLLSNGTSPFMAAGVGHRTGCSIRFGMLPGAERDLSS